MPKKSPIGAIATKTGLQSRRSFLGKLGLGAAALAAVSAIPFLKMGQNAPGKDSGSAPGNDSIFQPRQDPRN